MGFQDAIVVTDHGFYLNTAAEAGDVCAKPPGTWITIHERMLLGDGTPDAGSAVLPAETLGMRGDFSQAAVPRAMVAYRLSIPMYARSPMPPTPSGKRESNPASFNTLSRSRNASCMR